MNNRNDNNKAEISKVDTQNEAEISKVDTQALKQGVLQNLQQDARDDVKVSDQQNAQDELQDGHKLAAAAKIVSATAITGFNVANVCFLIEKAATQAQVEKRVSLSGTALLLCYYRAIIHSVIKNSTLTTHKTIKDNLHATTSEEQQPQVENKSQPIKYLAAATVGIAFVDTLTTQPISNTRAAADMGLPWNKSGKELVSFFTLGYTTRFSSSLCNAIFFLGPQTLMNKMFDHSENNKNNDYAKFAATVGAGYVCGYGTNFLSVLYKKKLLHFLETGSKKSVFDIAAEIQKNVGIKGFFKGAKHSGLINMAAYVTILGTGEVLTKAVFPQIDKACSSIANSSSFFKPSEKSTANVSNEVEDKMQILGI